MMIPCSRDNPEPFEDGKYGHDYASVLVSKRTSIKEMVKLLVERLHRRIEVRRPGSIIFGSLPMIPPGLGCLCSSASGGGFSIRASSGYEHGVKGAVLSIDLIYGMNG